MKSKGNEFWLFGIDAVVELSQKGVIAFLENAKQFSHRIHRKIKQQQKTHQKNKKKRNQNIEIGKEQDTKAAFEQLKEQRKKTSSQNVERIQQLSSKNKSKENKITHEPEP